MPCGQTAKAKNKLVCCCVLLKRQSGSKDRQERYNNTGLGGRCVDVVFSHDNGSLLVDHQFEEERRSAELTMTGMRRIRTLTYDTAMACRKDRLD